MFQSEHIIFIQLWAGLSMSVAEKQPSQDWNALAMIFIKLLELDHLEKS